MFNKIGIGTSYGLKTLHQCGKSVETKGHKVFGTNSLGSYRGKTGRRLS